MDSLVSCGRKANLHKKVRDLKNIQIRVDGTWILCSLPTLRRVYPKPPETLFSNTSLLRSYEIWKSYTWNAKWRIIWPSLISVRFIVLDFWMLLIFRTTRTRSWSQKPTRITSGTGRRTVESHGQSTSQQTAESFSRKKHFLKNS